MNRNKEETAAALRTSTVKGEKNCAHCLGDDKEEQCMKVVDIKACKNIIKKFGWSLLCIHKGHRAFL